MNIDFNYSELMTIQQAVEKEKMEYWLRLTKRIKKGITFKKIKQLKKEFDSDSNPWKLEGRCNIILEKIEQVQEKINKIMEE